MISAGNLVANHKRFFFFECGRMPWETPLAFLLMVRLVFVESAEIAKCELYTVPTRVTYPTAEVTPSQHTPLPVICAVLEYKHR